MRDIFFFFYNKVLSFFVNQTPHDETKAVAMNRLKTVLMQDRVGFSERAMQMLKEELVSTISKYMEIDEESKVECNEESSSTSSIEESSVVSEDENTYEEVEETSSEESSSEYSEETIYIDPEVKQPTQNEEEVVEEQIEDSEPDTESTSSVEETENTYTEEDLYYLTCAIVGEGQNVSFEEQIAVASVVVNRLNSEWFDYSSIKEVCTAPGQYTSFSNGMAYREPTEENIAAAKYVLEHGSQLPGDCIFQSLHQQGNGVYKYFADTGTYICYK